eukprot:2753218-Karenia_brevis.AAC.1
MSHVERSWISANIQRDWLPNTRILVQLAVLGADMTPKQNACPFLKTSRIHDAHGIQIVKSADHHVS